MYCTMYFGFCAYWQWLPQSHLQRKASNNKKISKRKLPNPFKLNPKVGKRERGFDTLHDLTPSNIYLNLKTNISVQATNSYNIVTNRDVTTLVC